MMLPRLRARLRALWHWNRRESELDEEVQFHLSEEADERVADGLTVDQARTAARTAFGNATLIREATRDTWGWGVAERLIQDVRYAARSMRRHPTFSAVAVLTLSLGIGANTAIFSLVNSLLLRPLSVGDPQQLVVMADPSRPARLSFTWSYPLWTQIRQRPQLFDGAFAYFYSRFNLAPGGATEFVEGLWASGGFFDTLRVPAALGRLLNDADDRRDGGDAGPVAVISHRFWQRRFGGADDVLGRTLSVDRVPFTIVGVLPREFAGPVAGRACDVVIPLGMASVLEGPAFLDHTGASWLTIMARLRPDQTRDAARAALRGIQPRIREASLPPGPADRVNAYLKEPLTLLPAGRGNPLAGLRVRSERPLLAMQMAVGLVLLIACVNVANLTLARAVTRRREMSLRIALGASPWRLTRQLFVESLLLAGIGAAGGLLLAPWGTRLLLPLFTTDTSALALQLTPDSRVLLFTAGITIAATVLFGVLPGRRAIHVEPVESLKEQGITQTGTPLRLANAFVIAQIGLSLVLVVGGGLLMRTYANLMTMDMGFESSGVVIIDVDTRKAHVPPANRLIVFEDVRRAVAAIPGVTGAAVADLAPVTGAAMAGPAEVIGAPSTRGRETFVNRIGPGWLAVYRTPVIGGRDFTHADRAGSRRVAIVNRAFAREFLGGADPLGRVTRQLQGPPGRPPMQWDIVGVTADAVYESLRAPVPPTMYLAFDQIDPELLAAGMAPESMSLSVRTAAAPSAMWTRTLAAAIGHVNPDLDLTVRAMPDVVNGSIAIERALAILSGFFGGLALLLAAVGLYGVTSYAVGQRRVEIGIRVALGATRVRVVRQVLSRVLLLLGIGVAIGAAGSLWASRFLATLLYGVESRDAWTFIGALGVLSVVGTLAGWLPAWRAARADPMITLRCD